MLGKIVLTSLRLVQKWCLGGILFGLMFPTGAILIDMFLFADAPQSVVALVRGNPLHHIILLAPIVLGLTFLRIGQVQERLQGSISQLSEAEREQWHLAHHDALTGLGNRLKMMADLAVAKHEGLPRVIILFDLDKFKRLNDIYGHDFGDAVLCRFADIIREVFPPQSMLYRLGGDEFFAILPASVRLDGAPALALRLEAQLNNPQKILDTHLRLRTSMGITEICGEPHGAFDDLNCADIALYRAKANPHHCFEIFEPDMLKSLEKTKDIQDALEYGLENGEFYLEFQPVHFAQSGAIKGAEALIRWAHPEMGRVLPSDFIPIAEESGQVLQVGHFVLKTACTAAAHWPEPLSISVNISILHFQHPDFHEEVMDVLFVTGLPSTRLIIEITETLLLDDPKSVSETIRKLRATGVRISLDDFGDGFTSIKHLLTLSLDELKLDMSLKNGIADDPQTREIIKGIVTIADAIDLAIVIEGIETSEELAAASAFGIAAVQGYHFSKPLSETALHHYIAKAQDVA